MICGEAPDGYYIDTGNGSLICMNCAQLICYMVQELNKEIKNGASGQEAVDSYNQKHGRRAKKEREDMGTENQKNPQGWKQDAPIEAFWIPIKEQIVNNFPIHPDEIKRLLDKKIKDREDIKIMAARLLVDRYDKLRVRYDGLHLLAKMKDQIAHDPSIKRMGKDICAVLQEILDLTWL